MLLPSRSVVQSTIVGTSAVGLCPTTGEVVQCLQLQARHDYLGSTGSGRTCGLHDTGRVEGGDAGRCRGVRRRRHRGGRQRPPQHRSPARSRASPAAAGPSPGRWSTASRSPRRSRPPTDVRRPGRHDADGRADADVHRDRHHQADVAAHADAVGQVDQRRAPPPTPAASRSPSFSDSCNVTTVAAPDRARRRRLRPGQRPLRHGAHRPVDLEDQPGRQPHHHRQPGLHVPQRQQTSVTYPKPDGQQPPCPVVTPPVARRRS